VKTVKHVMAALKKKGDAQTRKTYVRYGAPENMFGVKVADMKVIAKQIKGNQDLTYELFDTGNCDARYLSGLVADGSLMTRSRLNQWARDAVWTMVSDWTVAWVASENDAGPSLALKWMKAKKNLLHPQDGQRIRPLF
jgi:3-methyladenine DNA glycosylase AlkD